VKKVAYDTMSKRERKARHLAAATYLRSALDEDELVEVIASHLLDAYLAAPDDDDSGRIRVDALETLRKASERAASLGANEEAQRYAERAIELADDPLAEAELRERAGMMAVNRLYVEPAIAHFQRAISLFESEGALHPAARVSARLGEAVWAQGRGADALETMEESYRVLADEEPDSDLAHLAAQLARVSYFAGDGGRALDRAERALEIAEALDLPEVLSDALNTKCLIFQSFGRANESEGLLRHALAIALEHDKQAAALARKVGSRYWESSFLGHCYARFALGRWDGLIDSLNEIPEDEFARARVGFAQGYVAFGVAVEVQRGDLKGASHRLTRFAELEYSADVQEVAEYACGAARLRLAEGDPKEALRYAEMGIAGRETLSLVHSSAKESVVAGLEAALTLEDPDKVEEILEIVRSDPLGRRAPYFQAHASRIEARSPERAEDDAERLFKSSIGSFREIGFPFWMAVTLLEYGEWLDSRGRGGDAAPHVEEARSIFEGLSARPWLERAERVSRSAPVTS
jgi:tetratricopeptide (TPR) repeat protein